MKFNLSKDTTGSEPTYYLSVGDTPEGPYTINEVIKNGKVGDLVWSEEIGKWTNIENVREFQGHFKKQSSMKNNLPTPVAPKKKSKLPMIIAIVVVLGALVFAMLGWWNRGTPSQVLDAMVVINHGLARTASTLSDKNDKVYANFEAAAASNPTKAGAWKSKAFEVRDQANAIVGSLEDLKIDLIIKIEELEPGGREVAIDKIGAENGVENTADMDKPAAMMINAGKGAVLRAELTKFREFMLNMIKPQDAQFRDAIYAILQTNDPLPVGDATAISWESKHFEHLPAIAVMCNLSQIQAEIRNAEAKIIAYLEWEIDGTAMQFNKVEAIVIPEKTYVTRGDTFRADIFL
ncbi:MAG TPA: hypothetical protein EYN69_02525, partial [Flavobacteriales bacterium]|nr:hypothetical protein [Flavobacteriales bacterium]